MLVLDFLQCDLEKSRVGIPPRCWR